MIKLKSNLYFQIYFKKIIVSLSEKKFKKRPQKNLGFLLDPGILVAGFCDEIKKDFHGHARHGAMMSSI